MSVEWSQRNQVDCSLSCVCRTVVASRFLRDFLVVRGLLAVLQRAKLCCFRWWRLILIRARAPRRITGRSTSVSAATPAARRFRRGRIRSCERPRVVERKIVIRADGAGESSSDGHAARRATLVAEFLWRKLSPERIWVFFDGREHDL